METIDSTSVSPPVCAGCGLVFGLGFLGEDGSVIELDPAPELGPLVVLRENPPRNFCSCDCLLYWFNLSDNRRVTSFPEPDECDAGMFECPDCGIFSPSVSGKPLRCGVCDDACDPATWERRKKKWRRNLANKGA